MIIDNLDKYALIFIYPNGVIDKILIDDRAYHMQYYMNVINKSRRLQEIIKRNNIKLPKDENEAIYMTTYDIDTILAKDGIIVFHNLFPNHDLMKELDLEFQNFFITLPNELSIEQREIMNNLINKNNVINSWYGKYDNGKLIDIKYDEFKDMVINKIK